jgi:oligosaccharide repeat unit polymerase
MSLVKKIVLFIICISFLITLFEIVFNFGLSNFILLTSCLILLIVSFPIIYSKTDNVFSILPYLFYFLFLNVFLRNLYIIHDLPSVEYVRDVFLFSENIEFIFNYQLIFLLSFFFFILGYLIIPELKFSKVSGLKQLKWDHLRFNIIATFLLLISLSSLIYFIYTSNSNLFVITLENISGYRGVSDDLADYNANGLSRILIQLSVVLFYLSYVRRNFIIKSLLNNIFLLLSGSIALFYFFYTQSRSGFIYLFINCFILNYFIDEKGISKKRIMILFFIVISSFAFMTSLRKGNGYNLEQNLESSILSIFDPLVANNGGIDISKTGHIIKYVDSKDSFKYGSSYIWIIQSFVPRSLWSTKPANIDTEVGFKIYDANSYGTGAVPPGLIAESYWNFGYIGIVFVSLFCGMFLKKLTNYFNGKINNIDTLLIYVVCIMPIGLSLYGSSVSSTIVGILYYIIPFLIVFKFVNKQQKTNVIKL